MKAQSVARSGLRPQTAEHVRCILVETGAAVLSQAGSDGFDESIAIAQMQGEPPAEFAQRVMSRLAAVERSGRHFESAEVLTGSCHDAASKAARRLVVLGLSAHAQTHGGMSELLLTGAPDAPEEARAEMLGLVDEVLASPLPVRLRFDQERPREQAAQ